MIQLTAQAKIKFLTALIATLTLLTACTGSVTPKTNAAADALVVAQSADCKDGKCPCNSPLGPIADGVSIPVYSVAQVACGSTCASLASQLTCHNGTWDKDTTNLSFSCQVQACQSCKVGTNNIVGDGQSISMYSASQSACGQSCQDLKQVQTCSNGILLDSSGNPANPTYNQVACVAPTCSCRLPDNSGALSLGGSQTFYSQTNGTCTQSCASLSQSRTCSMTGTGSSAVFSFNGSSAYQYSSCQDVTPAQCECALPGGLGTLGNGASYTLYSQSSVSCTTCATVSNASVTCQNGTLVNQGSSTAFSGAATYKYNCQQTACLNSTQHKPTPVAKHPLSLQQHLFAQQVH